MAGIKALRKIQLGKEVTAGTAVAASTIWNGMGVIEDTRKIVTPEADVGLLVPPNRTYTASLAGELAMDSVEATFEQLPYILEGGVLKIGTGVADGPGSGKIYNYTFPEATQNTIQTFTIEGGDNVEAEEMEYSFVSEFSIEGKGQEAIMMSATWQGRQVVVSTFTGALSIPTVEEILFGKGKVYIDDVTDDYGDTQVSNTVLEMSLKVTTGWTPVWTADGNIYFTFAKGVRPEIEMEITFEHDATSQAEKVAWRDGTSRLIQLKFQGSALTTPGTAYTYKTLVINLAGKWTKFDKLDEQDGNDVVKGTFVAGYDPTKADVGNIIVVNELASLP